ncbi:hypothetical protein Y1Q_0010600 [Alligator mississippiensis]|uniref:Ig-like domain-containing protein n=1 Tax=Alligator mississippiensis TaxID=8496 RepID=A0A151PGJ1_ALLMI|nr:hypothetical protein Y1Q_0010600 [Alligator mississippiensis]
METCLILSLSILTMCSGAVRGDSIEPEGTQVTAAEGDNVTLRCNYKTSNTYAYYLYWYRHYPDRALQFIVYRGIRTARSTSNTADFAQKRFSSQTDDNSTALEIMALELADTAVYYCALRDAQEEHATGETYKNRLCHPRRF